MVLDHGLLVNFSRAGSRIHLLLQRLRELYLQELLVFLGNAHYLLAVQIKGILDASRIFCRLILSEQVKEHLEGIILQLRDEHGVDLTVLVPEQAGAIECIHVGQQGKRSLLKVLLLLRRQVLTVYLLLILRLKQLELVPELPVLSFDAFLVILIIVWQEALELLREFLVPLELEQNALDEGIGINI